MVSEKDFNLSIHEIFDENVYELCTTYPIFEDTRVVFLDLDKLSLLDNEYFRAFKKSPTEFTQLLILCRTIDKNSKFAKELKKEGLLVEIQKLKEEYELKNFILNFLKEHDGFMEPAALKEFIRRENYFEHDAVNLISVTNDLTAMLSLDKNITLNMVTDMVKDMTKENVFSLAKLLERGDVIGLRKELALISPDKAILTLSLLLREYRIAYKASFAPLSDIGVKYSTLRKLPKKHLLYGMDVCTTMIEDIKTGRVADYLALQMAIGQLINNLKGVNA